MRLWVKAQNLRDEWEWSTLPGRNEELSLEREIKCPRGNSLYIMVPWRCVVKKKKKHLVPSVFQETDWSSLKMPGGYFRRLCKQRSHYQRVALGQFSGHLWPQHRHSSPEGIRRQALLNFYHPPTSVSSVDFSESLQTLLLEHNTHHMWKKDHWLRPQPGRGRGSQLDFSNADLLSVSP